MLLAIGLAWGVSVFIGCSDSNSPSATSSATAQTLAFPEAEGFGRFAQGGRGGRAVEVTNLNERGPGSLRECAEVESGPRICIFRVAGTISLDTFDIVVRHPFLTIAGQTAPGGGITLRDGGIAVRASHVVIRHLRVRPGPASLVQRGVNANGIVLMSAEDGSATAHHMIDHCSVSWGTDDLVAVIFGTDNVTIQDSILSEGLSCNGCGSRGLLIGNHARRVSVIRTLSAHNFIRFPNASSGDIDFVNNVDYNGNGSNPQIVPVHEAVRINFVGNYFKDGPNVVPANAAFPDIRLIGGLPFSAVSGAHVSGNIGRARPTANLPENAIVWSDNGGIALQAERFDYPSTTPADALGARDRVLASAGATLPVRDAVDQRIVSEVLAGTGSQIQDPSEVGGWPASDSGTLAPDSDKDGMPDVWEERYGLNSNNSGDGGQDPDGDGYTNFDEYVNGTNPRVST